MIQPRYQIRLRHFDPAMPTKPLCTTVHDIGSAGKGMGRLAGEKHFISHLSSNSQNPETGKIVFQGAEWTYFIRCKEVEGHPDCYDMELRIQLINGHASHVNVAFECVFDGWSTDNYVLLPAAAYNGNRFESRRIAYSPKLVDPRDIGPDMPPIISDVPRLNIHGGPSEIHDRSGAMSTPSMGFYAPASQKGFFILTPQGTRLGDYGYKINETSNRKQATFGVSAPVIREIYKYRITDNHFPSNDIAPNWQTGDSLTMHVSLFLFNCQDIQGLFSQWNSIRYHMIPRPAPMLTFPFSATFGIQQEKFNRQNWVEQHGYYSVGMREMFLQDWQIGWTGGMISTYPLLFHGDETTCRRVLRNFDFLFPNGISPSGFFWDCGECKDTESNCTQRDEHGSIGEEPLPDNYSKYKRELNGKVEMSQSIFHWYGGDIRRPHTASWHLIRKSADALYYIIKQFQLMKARGIPVRSSWEDGTQGVADAFVGLWKRHGQLGQFVDSITGRIVVGGSASAGIAPAALALAAEYYRCPEYLDIAEEVAEYYYKGYVQVGLAMGGPGDALQNPDSESAYGLLESFALLFEHTKNKLWLNRAEAMASQFTTWVMGYDYAFPESCTLGRLGIKTRGAVFANTQNKHGAPGICTHSGVALLRLYRATKKTAYLELLRDIVRFIPQMLSHPKKPIEGMPMGWMTERVSTTDWFEGIGELMYGSTWAETALMLTYTEIPAVYVNPDDGFVFAIDSLDAEIINRKGETARLWLKNPSSVTVTARIMAETAAQTAKPTGENRLSEAPVVTLNAGETTFIDLNLK